MTFKNNLQQQRRQLALLEALHERLLTELQEVEEQIEALQERYPQLKPQPIAPGADVCDGLMTPARYNDGLWRHKANDLLGFRKGSYSAKLCRKHAERYLEETRGDPPAPEFTLVGNCPRCNIPVYFPTYQLQRWNHKTKRLEPCDPPDIYCSTACRPTKNNKRQQDRQAMAAALAEEEKACKAKRRQRAQQDRLIAKEWPEGDAYRNANQR